MGQGLNHIVSNSQPRKTCLELPDSARPFLGAHQLLPARIDKKLWLHNRRLDGLAKE